MISLTTRSPAPRIRFLTSAGGAPAILMNQVTSRMQGAKCEVAPRAIPRGCFFSRAILAFTMGLYEGLEGCEPEDRNSSIAQDVGLPERNVVLA